MTTPSDNIHDEFSTEIVCFCYIPEQLLEFLLLQSFEYHCEQKVCKQQFMHLQLNAV